MKKIIWPGLLAGILMLIVGMGITYLTHAIFPHLAVEFENIAIFRAMDDPLMSLFFVYPIILGLALAWLWNKVKTVLKGNKVLCFAMIYFFVATVPGMWISYSSFQLSLGMILTWTLGGLVNGLVAGLVFSKMNK